MTRISRFQRCTGLWIATGVTGAVVACPATAAVRDFASSEQELEGDPRSPARKELLRLIDELELKLPRDLARKLIAISMKLATGYCSPYPVKEFEDPIQALPTSEVRKFEKEWKSVREHEHWPRMPQPAGQGPNRPGSSKPKPSS